MMTIRPIALADHPAVLAMVHGLTAFHGEVAGLTLDQLQRDTSGAHPWVRVLVAEVDGALVGYAGMVPEAKFHDGRRAMNVHHLFVEEHWRSKGVGRQLLDACQTAAKAEGCENITIGTAPQNIKAQEMYRAYGFEDRDNKSPQFKLRLT